jgi:HEAT repeat protein
MTRSPKSVDAKLQALIDHEFGKDAKHDEKILIAALEKGPARVMAKAAELAAERLCYGVITTLKEAFTGLLEDGLKKDPQCIGKNAIVRALVALDCPDARFYRASLEYRQPEPVWGGSADSATDVRSSCAMGLVSSGDPRALHDITVLLADSEVPTRMGAVRAIASGNRNEAELLLRAKVVLGDVAPEVLGECFTGLLNVAPGEALALVANQLAHTNEGVREYAALALGESQLPDALSHLQRAWEQVLLTPQQRSYLTRAAALHRSDAAYDWLITMITDGSAAAAEAALQALAIYKHNASLRSRVGAALEQRNQQHLRELFAKQWE